MNNKDVLSCIAQFLPSQSHPTLIGALAGVNSDFNNAFQAEACELGYAALRVYIEDDLQFGHGFVADPESADESVCPMQMFVLMTEEEEQDVIVYLCRGSGASVVFTSEAVGWDNLLFNCKEDWDKFSPWASLPVFMDLGSSSSV
jgi:hypothetical protein